MKDTGPRPNRRSETYPYRLAVPMDEDTIQALDALADHFDSTRSAVAQWLLKRAAEEAIKDKAKA